MAKRKSSKAALDEEKRRLSVLAVRQEEERRSKEASRIALLQLNLGRAAQMYGIYSALALALNAFLATAGNLGGGFAEWPIFQEDYFLWIIALLVGLICSVAVVMQKAGPYSAQKGSGHFVLSVLGVVISAVLLVLVLLHIGGQFVISYTAWIYPASVLGMSLTLISVAGTWEGRSRRKVASIVCAALPPLLLMFTFIPGIETSATSFKGYLVLAYLFGALAIEISGSLLLIVATATEAHEREIVKAGGTQLSLLRSEYEKSRQAVDYKEKALRAQEAHLDSREQDLRAYEEEINEQRKTAEGLQAKVDSQWKELKDLERQLTVMRVDVQTKFEGLSLRNKAFKDREAEVERLKDDIRNRETALLEREKELKRQEIDISEKMRKADERVLAADEAGKRIRSEMEPLEKRRTEIIEMEKDLELRESDVRLKIEQLDAVQAKDQETRIRELRDWEDKVLHKERDLARIEVELRRLDKDLKARNEEQVRTDAELQQQRLQLSDREKEFIARQKQLSDLETALAERARHIEQQLGALSAAKEALDAREGEYSQMFRSVKEMESVATSAKDDLTRQQGDFDSERQKAKVISQNLSREVKALNEKHRKLVTKEREVEQKESDLQLRSLEIDRREKALARAPVFGRVDEEREKVIELREKRLREREDEFRRRAYQKDKELEALETALKEKERGLAVAAGEEEAAAEPARAAEERLRTGIPRLDDLLFGGIKMNSNVLLVGPAFIGKEVVAYNFLAEGLKKGIPAVIVTTTKPPVEISKEIAPVLPAFMEYEQLGLVKWIDASGTLPAGSKPQKEGSTYKVNGATDFENIMSIIDLCDSEFKAKKNDQFRLAYVTLSSSTTQVDERAAAAFTQKLVNRLKQSKAVSFITLERGMHTDQQIETLEHLADGAILFKTEKSKNLLSVVGLGEVQTREWVPYKFTNKSLIIGAFKLERIR